MRSQPTVSRRSRTQVSKSSLQSFSGTRQPKPPPPGTRSKCSTQGMTEPCNPRNIKWCSMTRTKRLLFASEASAKVRAESSYDSNCWAACRLDITQVVYITERGLNSFNTVKTSRHRHRGSSCRRFSASSTWVNHIPLSSDSRKQKQRS